ncbi:MAG TPA: xanthine dehydrogenase family protein subunit M [Casimicrobiaceae bacterium]
MRHFEYVRAATVAEAIAALAEPNTSLLAGGTNLVDLMKYDVARPRRVVDISHLPLQSIEELPDGALRIGALVPNADAAYDARVQSRAPLVASAILAGASPQLRNAATTGGNLLQRTRCFYFYDTGTPCNKREPGTGCSAIGGVTRMHAILGTSDHCIATHPSDLCVALAALRALVLVSGPSGDRVIPFAELHRLPDDRPEIDTTLARDEIIVAVQVPAWRYGKHYSYLKVRDRLSYAFALVSAAVALEIDDGRIKSARIALGGVAPKPWQNAGAEAALTGKSPTRDSFAIAADALLAGARGYGDNDFKIELARRTVVRALVQAAAGTPQSQSDKQVR